MGSIPAHKVISNARPVYMSGDATRFSVPCYCSCESQVNSDIRPDVANLNDDSLISKISRTNLSPTTDIIPEEVYALYLGIYNNYSQHFEALPLGRHFAIF